MEHKQIVSIHSFNKWQIRDFPSVIRLYDSLRLGGGIEALSTIKFDVFAEVGMLDATGRKLFWIEVDTTVEGIHRGATEKDLFVFGKFVRADNYGEEVYGSFCRLPHFLAESTRDGIQAF